MSGDSLQSVKAAYIAANDEHRAALDDRNASPSEANTARVKTTQFALDAAEGPFFARPGMDQQGRVDDLQVVRPEAAYSKGLGDGRGHADGPATCTGPIPDGTMHIDAGPV